jgi:hypothetical protein
MCFLKVFEYSWQFLLDDSFIAGQVRQLKVIPKSGQMGISPEGQSNDAPPQIPKGYTSC